MKKYLKKIALFFTLFAVVDVLSGLGFSYLRSHAKAGETQKNYYIAEKCQDQILILGSSRAARHYDPQVLEDSLGMTCYNCGEPGCGIITAYARYLMVRERVKPALVIYEVTPGFDFQDKGEDNSKFLGRVRQYADKKEVRDMFLDLSDELEGVRLLSNMYCNNSYLVHNVMDNFLGASIKKGYEPLIGTLKNAQSHSSGKSITYPTDSVKMSYMARLISGIRQDNIPVVFMVSPRYAINDSELPFEQEYAPTLALCEKYNLPFVNHILMDGISGRGEYFHDQGHLNGNGATAYTKLICREIKQLTSCE